MEGQIFCVLPKHNSACYGCISRFFGELELSCVESGIMSPVVGIIGAYQALESIKLLTNFGTDNINKLHVFDAMTSSWQVYKVNKHPQCSICN